MIVIKVELHSAITGRQTPIELMILSNDGTSSDPKRGNYQVAVMRRGVWDKVQRVGRVAGHARLSLSIWVLILKALKSAGFEK